MIEINKQISRSKRGLVSEAVVMLITSPSNASPNAEDVGVELKPTGEEDMWHANNLISVGDAVRAQTMRAVSTETETGTSKKTSMALRLTVRVRRISFDPVVSQLRLSGPVISEDPHVSKGQYHTLQLELNNPFTIWKEFGWDSVSREALRAAVSGEDEGLVPTILLDKRIANCYLISGVQTILKCTIRAKGSLKRPNGEATTPQDETKRRQSYYRDILTQFKTAIQFKDIRPLIIAGPGFDAAALRSFMEQDSQRTGDKTMAAVAKAATVEHTSSPFIHSLREVLQSKRTLASMSNIKSARESEMMDGFFTRLRADDGRAWYGKATVDKAVHEGAVGTLFVNNSLFRSMVVEQRKYYVGLVDKVREGGGKVNILSSDHESGQRLDLLGGIAALLTYPLYDLDEEPEGGEGQQGQQGQQEGDQQRQVGDGGQNGDLEHNDGGERNGGGEDGEDFFM